jgi:plastocyanin
MNRWLALLLACVALSLVVAGCGGDDEESGGGEAQTTEQPAEDSGGAEKEEEKAKADGGTEVSMEGIKFAPESVSVSVGDAVTWVNNDTVGHDVTGDDFKSGDAGAMQNGDTFVQTFDKAGTFNYVCTVHPGMEGSVTVK